MEEKTPMVVETAKENMVQKDGRSYLLNGRVVVMVLILIVIAEAIWFTQTLLKPIPVFNAEKIQPVAGGRIILDSDRLDYKAGDIVPVKVRLSTGGRIADSIDVVLKFDPKALEATSSPQAFTKGEIYKDYPLLIIDPTNGVIKISALTEPGGVGFSGIGSLATVNLQAKGAGKTQITVEFTKNATTDSNIIEAGTTKDMLEEVYNLDLAISDGKDSFSQPAADGSRSCKGYTQYCLSLNGETGTQYCQGGGLKGSECLFNPRLTVSCGTCKTVKSK